MRYALPQPYEDLEHTADAGVRVTGATPEETLARLVLAYASLVAGGGPLAPERDQTIVVPGGGDLARAAVDLLRELHYLFSTERLLPAWCEPIRLGEGGAEVRVGFGRWDPELHAEGLDIKAVTLHAALFERAGNGWRAQAVFDI